MIELRYIKKLIAMLDGSSVDSVEISSDKGVKIRLSKTPLQRAGVGVATPTATPAFGAAPAAALSRQTPADGNVAMTEAEPKADTLKSETLADVKSPMVGTYYAAPEPTAKPFVSVGSRVTKGQVLCVIEAMKIMNEIESEVVGVVKEVLVQDAHPVEYGQVLFRVDPNG